MNKNQSAQPRQTTALKAGELKYDEIFKAPLELADNSKPPLPTPGQRVMSGVRLRDNSIRGRLIDQINNEVSAARSVVERRMELALEGQRGEHERIVGRLRDSLHRSHGRHAEDLIEAHGASARNGYAEATIDRRRA